MASPKLLMVSAVLALLSVSASASFLSAIVPTIMLENYSFGPTREGYHFTLEVPSVSKREEMGIIRNPGTPEEELVVVGSYSVYDEKTDTESMTVYTADKDGYKAQHMFKNRKLSGSTLKTMVG